MIWAWLGRRFGQGDISHKQLALAFGGLALARGLAAFFWLPVFLERDAVNLTSLIGQDNNYDFHTHFLTWRELLSPSKLLDWGATEPAFTFNVGLWQWLLAGVGGGGLGLGQSGGRFQAAFFALAAAVLLFLLLPWSTVIWETVPFLPYFQFPWRLLGALAPMLAVLAGVAVSAWSPGSEVRMKWAGWLTAVCVALPLIFAMPLSQPAPWPEFGEVNVLRMSLIENTGRWLGTTSTADYVPATVDMIPNREPAVVGGLWRRP
ncbi:MAG: hypothetical protein M5U34_07420 [Chloroflexi bacterium]|nr:hypothetical protein [Chloroflexota bacterium]